MIVFRFSFIRKKCNRRHSCAYNANWYLIGVLKKISPYTKVNHAQEMKLVIRLSELYLAWMRLYELKGLLKHYVPPIWIYTLLDAHLSPPSICFDQKCTLMWIICFYFSFFSAGCSKKMRKRHIRRELFTEKLFQREDIRLVTRSFWGQPTSRSWGQKVVERD